MEQLPTSLAAIAVGLLAVAALARRLDHPVRPLEVVALGAGAALVAAAAVRFPGELLDALAIMGIMAAVFAALLTVLAALEAVPGLLRRRLPGRSPAARRRAARVPALARRP